MTRRAIPADAEPRGPAAPTIQGASKRANRQRLSNPARLRLAVEILAAYAQARRALRHEPIEPVIARLRSQAPPVAEPTAKSLHEARHLGRAVARLLTYVPGDTRCLARSLVLTRLLARRGIQAKLVIGAQAQPRFLAHAWVEHDGHPVLDEGDDALGRLVEL